MSSSRIRMTDPEGQRMASNVPTDYDWIHYHRDELLKKYGECSIIVYKEQVIGVGDSYKVALEDAERNLPPDSPEITPVYQILWHRHPFLRVRPTVIRNK